MSKDLTEWKDYPQIGLVMDFPTPDLVKGARDYCDQNGLFLDARWSVRGDWLPHSIEWDAVLVRVASTEGNTLMERMQETSMERVWLMPGQDGPTVTLDYEDCGRRAVEELVVEACASLAVNSPAPFMMDQLFNRGAIKAGEQLGVQVAESTKEWKSFEDEIKNMVKRVKKLPKPVGLPLIHAGFAFSLEKALMEEGLSIPDEVKIVVLDKDLQETAAMAPVPISGIETNGWHHGFVAAEMAHRLIKKEELSNEKVLIPAKGVQKRETTGGVSSRDMITAEAMAFVRENFREKIDVDDVVKKVGSSRRVIELRFRATMNRGVHEELSRLRINEAKRLLIEDPSMKISDVAEACGFASIFYFSAAFKRELGVSPRAFRKSQIS